VHLAEKGPNSTFGHCPDPNAIYELNKAGFAGKEVWVIPEYEANLKLTQRIEWLAENFNGIPIVIDMFEGGDNPSPNVILSIEDLEQIMAVANVTAVRIPELVSWYMRANEPIPATWIHDIFNFAIARGLKIYWSEWKLGTDLETLTNTTLAGYEDLVTYLYQTNNQYQHSLIGYSYAHEFQHWGASVQSWYVDEQDGTRDDLSVSIVAGYAALARNMGAESIELEPYWYFMENSEPLEPIQIMWTII
jgi:hypothetical protein